MNARLDAAAIRAAMGTLDDLPTIRIYDTIDSTNTEAKRLAAAGQGDNIIVTADTQTAGRGRRGRSFFSPADTGVYLSVCFRIEKSLADTVCLTGAAAVAVTRAIERLTAKHVGIKWVNDIYLDGKKVCGILAEGVSDTETGRITHMVIGIGLNVSTVSFPDAVKDIAASLDSDISRNVWIGTIAAELLTLVRDPDPTAFLSDYRAHSVVLGRRVTFTCGNGTDTGIAEAITDDGGLVVRRDDGTRETLHSGEITVRVMPQESI